MFDSGDEGLPATETGRQEISATLATLALEHVHSRAGGSPKVHGNPAKATGATCPV